MSSNPCTERLYHSRSRFSKKVMVSIGVSWNRKIGIFFIDPQKTKVDQNCYIDLLKTSYCLNVVDYPGIDFVFMQDNAPSYHAKAT